MALLDIDGFEEDKGVVNAPIPVSRQVVQITEVTLAKTSEKSKYPNEDMVKLKLEVVEGEFAGRILFDQLVIPSKNMEKRGYEFCRGKLKRLWIACGLDPKQVDTSDLQGARYTAVVGVSKNPSTGQDRNNITDYLPLG